MISVIIATRDRAALLATTLGAVCSQDALESPFEVLIVDNGSIDDTAAVAESAARRYERVSYLYEGTPGKSHALNAALARARGDVLVFTDDDVLPSPNWLSAYVRAFAETGADYATGRILPLWEAPPPRWLSPALYGVLAVPDGGERRLTILKGLNDHIMPLGANMAIRRHVLDRVASWNPDLGKLQGTLRTGEDHEFSLRMMNAGFVGVYEPQAVVQHRVPAERLRLGYFQRWFYDNGAIEARMEDDYPTTDRYVLDVPRYLWRETCANLLAIPAGLLKLDIKRVIADGMRLAWFGGYLRERWGRRMRRSGARVRAHAAPLPRS